MTLGMVSDVDEEATQSRGEMFLADGPGLLEIGGGKGTDSSSSMVEGGVEFAEKDFAMEAGIGFGSKRSELLLGERLAFRIGQKSIDTARDVAKLKRDRR